MNSEVAFSGEPFEILNPVVITSAVSVMNLDRKATTPTSAPVALLIEDADP